MVKDVLEAEEKLPRRFLFCKLKMHIKISKVTTKNISLKKILNDSHVLLEQQIQPILKFKKRESNQKKRTKKIESTINILEIVLNTFKDFALNQKKTTAYEMCKIQIKWYLKENVQAYKYILENSLKINELSFQIKILHKQM